MNTTNAIPLSLTDNLWSNIRWQWWQPFFLGACNRTTTWFHHRSSSRCCGKPVTSHLGNPLNSCSTFFRLSMVTKHSTQNMIFTCTSKGNTLPNGLSSGSTSPWYFMLTGKAWMWPLRSVPPYSSVPWTNPLLVPGPWSMDEKVYPWGVRPRVSFRSRHPHVIPLHQSAPWVDSVKHAALPVVVHSALFSYAVQYGEFTPSVGIVLRAPRGPSWLVEDGVASSPAERLFERPVPARYPRGAAGFGQDSALGPPHRQKIRSRSPSP